MTIFSLIVGLVLGAVSVLFILQNVAPVTVAFLGYELTASLAIVLLLTLLSGLLISLLILLPSIIKDIFYVSSLKRENKRLQDELAARGNAVPASAAQEQVVI